MLGILLLVLCWVQPVQAADLPEIRDRGYLIIGVKDNLRPLGFRDQNQLQGFEIDIAQQLASELLDDATAVQFRPLLNQDRLRALLEGEVDLLVARMTVTESRMRVINFSYPYFIDGTAFLTNSAAIQSLRDLSDQPVAVLEGSDTIASVRSLLPRVRLRGAASYEAARVLLDAGEVGAVAADGAVLTGWSQEDPRYRLLPTLISAEPLAVATPKGRQYRHLRQRIDQAIEGWLASGWLRQQIAAWGLPAEGFPDLNPTERPARIRSLE